MTQRTPGILALAFAAMVLPDAAPAQDGLFDGDWAGGDPMACDMSGASPENFALRIRGDLFRGPDSECRMTNPVTLPGLGVVLYDMNCASNGENETYRALMMVDRNGQLVMISDGSAVSYPRCEGYVRPQPDQTAAPALPRKGNGTAPAR